MIAALCGTTEVMPFQSPLFAIDPTSDSLFHTPYSLFSPIRNHTGVPSIALSNDRLCA